MKKLLLLLFVSSLFTVNAQKRTKSTDTINLSTVDAKLIKKKFRNGFDVKVLILEDGSIVKKGSELIVGVPSNNMNVNNNVYNGVKTSATSIDFTYLMVNKYSTMNLLAPIYFGNTFSSTEIIVERIRIYRSGKKVSAIVDFTKKDGTNTALGKFGSCLGLSDAIKKGELINPNAPMTRAEAIAKLKEAKDLMEIDMMSIEEFEILKAELKPIIMNN